MKNRLSNRIIQLVEQQLEYVNQSEPIKLQRNEKALKLINATVNQSQWDLYIEGITSDKTITQQIQNAFNDLCNESNAAPTADDLRIEILGLLARQKRQIETAAQTILIGIQSGLDKFINDLNE